MIEIRKSQIWPSFVVDAAAHAKEMRDWRAHMYRVSLDADDESIADEHKHAPFPRPRAHPIIEAVIDENGEASYRIIDDGPTPDQILAARKHELLGLVSAAEAQAIAAAIPIAKMRLFNLREGDIIAADAARGFSFLDKAKAMLGRDAQDLVAAKRPAEDTQFLAEQQARRDRIAKIHRAAAEMQAEIDDLTAETIDHWTMKPFEV